MAKKKEPVGAEAQSVESVVACGSHVDIASVGTLRDALLAALEEKKPVVIDASEVERIDTAALQVLTAFFVDAQAQNLKVRWQDPSSALYNAAGLLGLKDSLGFAQS